MTNGRYLGVVIALLAVGGFLPAADKANDEEGFKPLFNGKDLTGFKIEPPTAKETFQVQDGVIVVSGQPNGYFYTEKPYRNYQLRFEVMYPKKAGNSGVLLHIQEPHRVWPKCIEAQGLHSDMGRLFGIGGAKGEFTTDKEAQKAAIKPVGQWNRYEIISQDGMLTTKINGKEISRGKGSLTEGPIGWQSEGVEIHFRKIEIKELK